MIKIVSWNLLRLTGATLADVVRLVRRERPDLLLMQEATAEIDALAERVGGSYARAPLPGRVHGLAMWSPVARLEPRVLALPSGAVVHRICQVAEVAGIGVANVHLSHGQVLNRRQLRVVSRSLPARAAVLGDYNLVGPAWLPGFRDVGPRAPTHHCVDVVPLRLDRCYVRGLDCLGAAALDRDASDHRPIAVALKSSAADLRLAA